MTYPITALTRNFPTSLQHFFIKLTELQTRIQPIAYRYLGHLGNAYLIGTGAYDLYLNAKNPAAPTMFKLPTKQELLSERYYLIVHGFLGLISGTIGLTGNFRPNRFLNLTSNGFFSLSNAVAIYHYKKIYSNLNSSSAELQNKNRLIKFSTILGFITCSSYISQSAASLLGYSSAATYFGIFAISIGTVKFCFDWHVRHL